MQSLDPKSVWLFFVNLFLRSFLTVSLTMIFSVGILSGYKVSSFGTWLAWLWLLVPVLIIFAWIWAKLSYRFYRYELRGDGFRKEHGVIYKKYVSIPYARIQNVDIYRSLPARILGLSDLHIQTAGASANVSRYGIAGIEPEGRLPGLSSTIAEQLRDELIRRAKQPYASGSV
ncbi:hypothetical protein A3I57_02920 [Candidatus Beckwithbacteria bacterium RIFCSPLOWO2_02_FULL_47_23]|uniref:YdbS-like PH domain-containing protein n=2 Tax=Candidatus Beckwithiibacteriota TaxID=1752726 RepID=A0A1F5DZ91_9BACT|nr:MAG: hypothetical protein A3E73_00440 [Candidatus Beckwithbacteria bacterium RIFCSPHIGHO2_12_FULL_47_17]OGD60469.1 MAG: hypothetical protein A3I57_02920 [Candidatus Beckwithbacteria bacterium RIFCSPLOWO2_02_FULL_47_23]